VAACSETKDLVVVYTPAGDPIKMDLAQLATNLHAIWFDPRNGAWIKADVSTAMQPPTPDDWLLLVQSNNL
jgi:hypothetical protein